MRSLKNALAAPPVLTIPNATGQMTLDTNACDARIGCMLPQLQQPDSTEKPNGQWCRFLTEGERKYATIQRE